MNDIEYNPPFEVGEYVDIKLRVYFPKETKEHFGEPFRVAMGVSWTMNRYYERFQELSHWSTDQIWFAPIMEVDLSDRPQGEINHIKYLIKQWHKYGEVKLIGEEDGDL